MLALNVKRGKIAQLLKTTKQKKADKMKTITIEFNQHQFDIEYIIDEEMYVGEISIESIKLNGVDFYWNFNGATILEIEKLVIEALK